MSNYFTLKLVLKQTSFDACSKMSIFQFSFRLLFNLFLSIVILTLISSVYWHSKNLCVTLAFDAFHFIFLSFLALPPVLLFSQSYSLWKSSLCISSFLLIKFPISMISFITSGFLWLSLYTSKFSINKMWCLIMALSVRACL